MRNKNKTRTTKAIILNLVVLIFLKISSIDRPALSSKIVAEIKSNEDQTTSLVNCMAINGINNRSAMQRRIAISLIFDLTVNS